MPKVVQSHVETEWDSEGNVLTKRENKTLSWGDEPSYIKLYIQDIMYLADMPKRYATVTKALLKRVAYAGEADGLCVTLVPRTKRAICKEIGWEKVASLDNALQKLMAGKILYRVDRGIYRFNPYLFGRGDWQDIARLRLEIQYDEIQGRTFKTVINYKDEQGE